MDLLMTERVLVSLLFLQRWDTLLRGRGCRWMSAEGSVKVSRISYATKTKLRKLLDGIGVVVVVVVVVTCHNVPPWRAQERTMFPTSDFLPYVTIANLLIFFSPVCNEGHFLVSHQSAIREDQVQVHTYNLWGWWLSSAVIH